MKVMEIDDLFYGMNVFEKKGSEYVISEITGFKKIDALGCDCIVETKSQTTSINMIKGIQLSEDNIVNNLKFRKLGRYSFVKDSIFIHKRKRGFVYGGKNGVIINYVSELQNIYKFKTKKRLIWN
jgi:hypothetical protein